MKIIHLSRLCMLYLLVMQLVACGTSIRRHDKNYEKYHAYQFTIKSDTFIEFYSGCRGADIRSEYQGEDGKQYQITKRNGRYTIAEFDKNYKSRFYYTDNIPVVDSLYANIDSIRNFIDTILSHPNSQNYLNTSQCFDVVNFAGGSMQMYNNTYDMFGNDRQQEKWFVFIRNLIGSFYYWLKDLKRNSNSSSD